MNMEKVVEKVEGIERRFEGRRFKGCEY